MIAEFTYLRPTTLRRVADFLTDGGRPLEDWENRIARRALRIADWDAEDASALLHVAADYRAKGTS